MKDLIPSPGYSVRILLEAVSAAVQVCPWGVSAVPSVGCFFVWDARDDSSFAIMDSVCEQFGMVTQSQSIEFGGQTIIGCLVRPDDSTDLSDAAGRLRVAYSIANDEGGAEARDPPRN